VTLPPKVYETLLVLLRNHGHALGKDQLMRELWPDTFVEESNLAQNISLLRKALSEGTAWLPVRVACERAQREWP
jgi:DNA-binding winged helix-turn-helix (wHTH) protein